MNKFDSVLEKYISEGTITINTDRAAEDMKKLKGTQFGNAIGQLADAEKQGVTDPTTVKEPADILHGVLSDDKVNPITWDKVSDSEKAKVIDALVMRKIIPPPQAVTNTEKNIKDSTSNKEATSYGSGSTNQGGTLQGLSKK